MIKAILELVEEWNGKRKGKKFKEAVKLVESSGLTVCEIVSVAGTDYIRDAEGALHKIGGKK